MKKKNLDCQAQSFTFLFTPFYIQASTSLKKAFTEAHSTTESQAKSGIESDAVEPAKKRVKLSGSLCNAAVSCDSKALYKNDSTKTFFCREHYELLSKPAKKSLTKIKSWCAYHYHTIT